VESPRILIIGGGVAGVEAALTMAIGMPQARVTIVSELDEFDVIPNLVFVPFGADPIDVRLPLRSLEQFGIEIMIARVDSVDLPEHSVQLADRSIVEWDVLVVALGTASAPTDHLIVRSVEHALQVRRRLLALEHTWVDGAVLVRVLEGRRWTPAAYEFALMLDTWMQSIAQSETIAVRLQTPETTPCSTLHADTGAFLLDQIAIRGIDARFETSGSDPIADDVDLVVDFPPLRATHIDGLPPLDDDGFHGIDQHGACGTDAYVIGDAAGYALKGADAAAWQARRLLDRLGGDLSRLGDSIAGVQLDTFEYHLDLGYDTLVLDADAAASIMHGVPAEQPPRLQVLHDATDKLVGTLIRQELLTRSGRIAPSQLARRSNRLRAGAQAVERQSAQVDQRRPEPWSR
jgi:hypothetical protein